jgi:integral membrane protein (TIGR01906 family)
MGTRVGGLLVAAAAAVVILGASIAPFLTPAVVRFEQDRADVGRLTGYDPAELDAVTGALLGDLVLWSGNFEVGCSDLGRGCSIAEMGAGSVLSDAEQGHMRDVRGVFTGFWLLVGAGLVALALAFRRARGAEARAAAWRSVASGARALAIGIAVVGAFAVLAFEAAFEVFHRLFFSSGSYTFDPATDRLVQLFPMQFWSEIAIAVGAVALTLSILTAWAAGRRARQFAAPEPVRVLSTSQVPT